MSIKKIRSLFLVFISVSLTLVVNKYFAVSQTLSALALDKFCRDFWKGQTNFFIPVGPKPKPQSDKDQRQLPVCALNKIYETFN